MRFSIGVLENGQTYVICDRNVITGTDTKTIRKEITEFFNNLLDKNGSIEIPTISGEKLKITKKETADKARDNYKYVDGKPVVSSSKEEDKKINAANEEKKHKKPKPAFKFHMVGLNVGDIIVFDALSLSVNVASDDKIEYDGRLWSLSAFTAEFLPKEMQNTSGSYQGPKYFSYNGKVLSELRKENY